MLKPPHSSELSSFPEGPDISRRRLLQLTAIMGGTLLGLHRLVRNERHGTADDSHEEWDQNKREELLRQYRRGPLFVEADPAAFLRAHSEEMAPAFSEKPGGVVMCMDGRIVLSRSQRALRLAGDGIVLEKNAGSRREVLEAKKGTEYLEKLRQDGIEISGVSNHRCGCGACALIAKKLGLDPKHGDDLGEEYAKALSKKLRVPYNGASHIERNLPIHPEVAIAYDGTGRFQDPRRTGNMLPVSLVIHGLKQTDPEYSALELETATKIMLGTHGIGQGPHGFNAKNSIPVLAIYDEKEPHGKDRVLHTASNVVSKANERVKEEVFEVVSLAAPNA